MNRNSRWLFALPVVSALTLVACTAKPPSAAKVDHAQVEKDARKVTLTSDAAKHLAIQTGAVREEPITRTRIIGGEVVALPASALSAPPPPARPSVAPEQFPIVVDERFELNTSGWPNEKTSTAWLDSDGLGYRLAPNQPGHFVAIAAPGQTDLRDALVSATFRKTAGPSGGGYGLILRDQDSASHDGLNQGGSYYVFEVSDRAEYGVWRRDGDRWVDLVRWTASDVVRPAGAENTLAVSALGDSMTFIVNGTPITTQTDTDLRSGGVGIFAGGDGDQFLVDRLTVRAPKPEPAAIAPATEGTRLAVRVPLTPSDQNQVVPGESAKILPLIPDPMASGALAQPADVAGEPGALFYIADGAALSAGQRVRVEVPLVGGGVQRKFVPYSSVIYDLKGDAWAYTSPAPLTYVRDRISIDFIEGDKAVLTQGPAAGTAVVTTGAAELFGTESGVGH